MLFDEFYKLVDDINDKYHSMEKELLIEKEATVNDSLSVSEYIRKFDYFTNKYIELEESRCSEIREARRMIGRKS